MNKNIKSKLLWIISVICVIVLFFSLNIIELDRKWFFRFETEVFLKECSNEDAKKLETMPLIHCLEIQDCTADNIDFIENMPFLTELSILKYRGDWSKLKKCENLTSFSVTNSTFDDLKYFSEMEKLENLDFAVFSNDVKIDSIDGIEKIKSLKTLTINGLSDDDISSINSLLCLETLNVQYSSITSIELENEKLLYISLSNNHSLERCDYSEKCINVKEIIILDCPNIIIDVDELIKLPELCKISISKGMLKENEIDKLASRGIEVIVLYE